MVNLSEIELQVLERLNSSPDGQILKQILARRLAEQDTRCRTLDGPDLHRSQGRAQELALLLDDLNGARQKLEARGTQQGAPARRPVSWNPGH
jgi:hypothetical protein